MIKVMEWEVVVWIEYGVQVYGNHLTPGLTEVKSYAAFFTSFLAEGLRVRCRGIPALTTW